MERRKTNAVRVGSLVIGGEAPVSVQSMLNVPARDVAQSVAQAKRLAQAGCDVIRAAVPTLEDAVLISALKQAVDRPIVADIHFDYKIALACVERGVDKIRINPGNIGSEDHVKEVANACRRAGVPIRIGVNSGSVEKEILHKHGGPTPEALAESAMYHASLLEKFDFHDIVISVKSSDVNATYQANLAVARQCEYPLHIGVTEAGTREMGRIKSAAALGGLLLAGVGDTLRISLTDDPVQEVLAARQLLQAVGMDRRRAELIACPTCGRTKIDMIPLAGRVEAYLAGVHAPIKVAVMGCVVNGPGEAKEADVGIAGGDGCGVLFRKGEVIRKVPEDELYEALICEIEELIKE